MAVDQAVSEFQHDYIVGFYDSDGAAIITHVAEAVTEEILNKLVRLRHSHQMLSITDCRARILGLPNTAGKIATVATKAGLVAKMVGKIADSLVDYYVSGLDIETKDEPTYGNELSGLDTDERVYLPAVQMLEKLG